MIAVKHPTVDSKVSNENNRYKFVMDSAASIRLENSSNLTFEWHLRALLQNSKSVVIVTVKL